MVFDKIYGRHYWPCSGSLRGISRSDIRGSSQTKYMVTCVANLTVLEGRLLAKHLLHGFEISVAVAVMTGSSCTMLPQ